MKAWVKVDEVLGHPLVWYNRPMAEIIFLWDVYLNISHSLLRTILKAVFAQNIIFNEIYRAEFNKWFKFYISEYHKSKHNFFIRFFGGLERGCRYNIYICKWYKLYKHMYIRKYGILKNTKKKTLYFVLIYFYIISFNSIVVHVHIYITWKWRSYGGFYL